MLNLFVKKPAIPKTAPPVVNPLERLQNVGQQVTYQDKSNLNSLNIERRKHLPFGYITHTSLGFMSTSDIENLSVAECTRDFNGKDNIYVDFNNSQNDPKMGTTNSNTLCPTCSREILECPGHLGRIKLNRIFINPNAMEACKFVLQSVCNSCGKMYLDKDNLDDFNISELSGINRLKAIAKHSTAKHVVCVNRKNPLHANALKCPPNPEFNTVDKEKENGWDIKCKFTDNRGESNSVPLSPETIIKIFNSISKEDLILLGFTGEVHPRDYIMKYLPVIPETNRPSIMRDNQPFYDHLTLQYGKIINTNNKIAEIQKTPNYNENDYTDAVKTLYFYINHMFDNSNSTNKDTVRNDEALLSIKERLSNKDGYLRNNAMGKRVNFAGRTVAGPENGVKFGQVRYPQAMDILTVPEKVFERNLEFIRQLWEDNLIVSIIKAEGKRKNILIRVSEIKKKSAEEILSYLPAIGDIVNRKSLNGDETLINRQPTLHKYSMTGQKAIYSNSLFTKKYNLPTFMNPKSKSKPYLVDYLNNSLSIGLHSSMTTPMNADFDGDELNQHLPQTLDARAEVRHIVSCEKNIMSDQSSRPIVGLVYSCLVAGDLISQDDLTFTKQQWEEGLNCLLNKSRLNTNKFYSRLNRNGIQKYSGKAMFSILFPQDFYYSDGHKKTPLVIKEGILVSGILGKKHLGPSTGGIIQSLYKRYAETVTSNFITEAQYLLDWFLELNGFSIGIGDCIPKTAKKELELVNEINQEISATEAKIQQLGPENDNMTALEKEIREKKIQNYLGGMTRIGLNLGKNVLEKNNPLNVMSRSGAKGNAVNTAQIVGVVGQQFIKGQRPPMDMTNGQRCLPYFPVNSNSIFARGYVKNSFNKGLDPAEFYFHLEASRIGIMDTAIRTAETGYMHHKINKALEDVKIAYDGSVVGGSGAIFQTCYDDGYDASLLVSVNTPSLGTVLSPINFEEIINKLNLDADNADLEDEEEEEVVVEVEEEEYETVLFRDPEY